MLTRAHMTAETYTDPVRGFVVSELCDDEAPEGLSESTLLIEEGILDSLGIFEIVGWIEETYNLDIQAEDVVIEHFRTITDISGFIHKQISA